MSIVSASVSHRWHGELLLLTHRGVITARNLAEGREYLADRLAERDVRAVVADFRRATQAFDWRTALRGAAAAAGAGRLPLLPVAMVASPAEIELVTTFAAAMTEEGYDRAAFSDMSSAISWAACHRAHWPWDPALPQPQCPQSASPLCPEGASPHGCRRRCWVPPGAGQPSPSR